MKLSATVKQAVADAEQAGFPPIHRGLFIIK